MRALYRGLRHQAALGGGSQVFRGAMNGVHLAMYPDMTRIEEGGLVLAPKGDQTYQYSVVTGGYEDSRQVECLGPEAKKLLEDLVPVGSEVKLDGYTDGGEAHVINSAGVSVDTALLESGLGVSSDPLAVVP